MLRDDKRRGARGSWFDHKEPAVGRNIVEAYHQIPGVKGKAAFEQLAGGSITGDGSRRITRADIIVAPLKKILAVTDAGTPTLTAYRRVIFHIH